MDDRRTLSGIGLMLLAVMVFVLMDTIIKLLTQGYSVMMISAMRAPFALIPVLALAAARGQLAIMMDSKMPLMQFGRAAVFAVAIIFLFLCFRLMQLADAYALSYIAPVMVTVLAAVTLREGVGPWRWAAVLFGFIGVLVVARPGSGLFGMPALLALGSALFYAVAVIMTRQLGRHESSLTSSFYVLIGLLVIFMLPLPWFWTTPSPADLGLMAVAGLLGGCAQLLFTEAARRAEASVLAPLDYFGLVAAIGLGWLVWRDMPTIGMLAGASIIIGAGLVIAWRERVHNLRLASLAREEGRT